MTYLFVWFVILAVCWFLILALLLWPSQQDLSLQKARQKRLVDDLTREIVAIIENAERRDLRWRIGLAKEFRQEDPQ